MLDVIGENRLLPKLGRFFNNVIGGSNSHTSVFLMLIMPKLFGTDDVTTTSDIA